MTTQSITTPDELIPVFTANIDGYPVQACDARETHDREFSFLTSMWDCLGSRHVTVGDLYRIIISRQCLGLSNAAAALFGDIELWTAKKLVISLRSWSEHPITGYVLLAVNRSKHGILWRLERTG